MNDKYPPVDVNVENNSKFAQVVSLVDRDGFIVDLEKLRRLLGIKKLISHQQFEEQIQNEQNQYMEQKKKEYKHNFSKSIKIFKEDTYFEHINEFLKKHQRNIHYYNVIKFALFTGMVEEKDLIYLTPKNEVMMIYDQSMREYAVLPEIRSQKMTSFSLDSTEIALVIFPETTKKELLSIFDGVNRYRKEFPMWQQFDTKSKIKIHRKWYWLNKKERKDRLGYLRIFNLAKKDGEVITHWTTVRDGIKEYKKFLIQSYNPAVLV